jgi:hypothetical protein
MNQPIYSHIKLTVFNSIHVTQEGVTKSDKKKRKKILINYFLYHDTDDTEPMIYFKLALFSLLIFFLLFLCRWPIFEF